jgi:hypothetical protein
MDGARYLEDGRLTIFKRSGVYYARLRISPGKNIRLGRRSVLGALHFVQC